MLAALELAVALFVLAEGEAEAVQAAPERRLQLEVLLLTDQ
jgi:hypothetical protein